MDVHGPTIRQVRTVTALLVVFVVAFAGYGTFIALRGDAPPPTILISKDGEPAEEIRGTVELSVGPGRLATWSLHGPGDPVDLGTGTVVRWDSTQVVNGIYTLHAETERGTYSREIEVQNARRDVATTTAVVGTATAIATGGSVLTSSVANQVTAASVHVAKNTLLALGEDHLAVRTAGKRRFMPGWIALAITLLMVFLFFTFEDLRPFSFDGYFAALPIVGGVACAFVAAGLGVEALLAWAGRATSKIRFLLAGAIALMVSSIALRTPFGYPGYVDEDDDVDDDGEDDLPLHAEALRAAGSIMILLGLVLPFLWIGRAFEPRVLDVAKEIAIVTFATAAFPMKPMPGHDIWRWRRSAAVLLTLGAYSLYFVFQLGYLDTAVLEALAWSGIAIYVLVFAYLRARSAEEPSPWLQALGRTMANAKAALRLVAPAALQRAAHGVAQAGRWVGRWSARAFDQVRKAVMWAGESATAAYAARQDAKARREIVQAEADFLREAHAFLDGMASLPDDTVVTVKETQREVVIGELREAVLAIHAARGETPVLE